MDELTPDPSGEPDDPDPVDPVDPLTGALRRTYGEPEQGAGEPGPAGGWPEVERLARQQVQRRRLAGVAVAAVVVVALGAAALGLSGRGEGRTQVATPGTDTAAGAVPVGPAPSGSVTTSPPNTGSIILPTTMVSPPLPLTTVTAGPPTTSTTTGSTTSTTAPSDCGTAYLASGWPTTTAPSPQYANCILAAFDAGTPSTLVVRAQTDGSGGHVVITTYLVVGVHQVRRTVDATGAQPPGTVTVEVCTGLAADFDQVVVASGCRAA